MASDYCIHLRVFRKVILYILDILIDRCCALGMYPAVNRNTQTVQVTFLTTREFIWQRILKLFIQTISII